jgi:hypothetical protein
MRRTHVAALAVYIVYLLACGLATAQEHVAASTVPRNVRPVEVSLVQLIANPLAFDGQRIRAVGFLNLEFEGNAIYLHRDDFEENNFKNAIWINVPRMTGDERNRVVGRYCVIEGTFDARHHGHMGAFSGEIVDVTMLQVHLNRALFKKMIDGSQSSGDASQK